MPLRVSSLPRRNVPASAACLCCRHSNELQSPGHKTCFQTARLEGGLPCVRTHQPCGSPCSDQTHCAERFASLQAMKKLPECEQAMNDYFTGHAVGGAGRVGKGFLLVKQHKITLHGCCIVL